MPPAHADDADAKLNPFKPLNAGVPAQQRRPHKYAQSGRWELVLGKLTFITAENFGDAVESRDNYLFPGSDGASGEGAAAA
jgi:hypothetical protein